MVYGVWRQFRKATKRFLDRELEEDEQTVFLYPPKPKAKVSTGVPLAAIEARKKKTIKKNCKGMKALDVLAEAAAMVVRDIHSSSRSSFAGSSSPRSVASAASYFDDRGGPSSAAA